MENKKTTTVDEYIAQFSGEKKEILMKLREVIRKAAPDATEKISWQMPTYHQKTNLIHFAMQKNHVGIYPSPEAVIAFADELKDYKTSKGGIQLPLNKPIPYDLVKRITEYRVRTVTEGK